MRMDKAKQKRHKHTKVLADKTIKTRNNERQGDERQYGNNMQKRSLVKGATVGPQKSLKRASEEPQKSLRRASEEPQKSLKKSLEVVDSRAEGDCPSSPSLLL